MKKKINIYFNAPITLGFVMISLVALILNFITKGYTNHLLFATYKASIFDPLMYLRLFTHIFGHADITHFMNNMMFILLLGPILEEKYHEKLIYIILSVAFITGLFHNLFSNTALLGASGVVFAFILLASITGKDEGIPITLIIIAIFWIGNEIINGFMNHDNVSQMTHIIGGISGAGLGLLFKNKNFNE